jgi:hypothetical protein
MRVQFALCAQSASVDRASNRVSIFNVIDHIPATSLPIIIPSVTFVSIFENEKDEPATNFKGVFEAKVNGQLVAKGEVPVSFVNGRLARVILSMNSIPIREHGILSFRLVIPDAATAETQVQIIDLSPRTAPSAVVTPPTTS